MAVTIHSSPSNYSQSGNPLVVVFSSNQTGQANFSYKVEVEVGGNLVETYKIFPESGIKAHIDVSDIAERYAATAQKLTAYMFTAANDIEVNVIVTENYGTPPSDHSYNDIKFVVIKGRLRKSVWLNYNPTSYVFSNSSRWLTFFPSTEKRYVNLSLPNLFTLITNNKSLKWDISLYDGNGVLLENISESAFNTKKPVTTVNITYTTLDTNFGFDSNNIDATSYITVRFYDSALDSTELLTLWVDNRCYSSTYKHLLFLSTIGSLEPYTFVKRSVTSVNIKGNGFENQFGYFDDSGNYVFDNGGVTDYVKEIENKLDVQTDWIGEDEYKWLAEELLTSPLVYLYDNGDLIKVKVTNGSYELKTEENDMVFNLKVNIHVSNDTSTLV